MSLLSLRSVNEPNRIRVSRAYPAGVGRADSVRLQATSAGVPDYAGPRTRVDMRGIHGGSAKNDQREFTFVSISHDVPAELADRVRSRVPDDWTDLDKRAVDTIRVLAA